MKPTPMFSTAAAVTFAAGIALAGPGLRVPTDVRLRKEPGPAREAGRQTTRRVRAPSDPTITQSVFAQAITSGQTGA